MDRQIVTAEVLADHGLSVARFYWVARLLTEGTDGAEVARITRTSGDAVQWVDSNYVQR
jgi:predicted chitinase